ncbi:MAG TPA: Ku protein [Nitrospirota bacterium]|nr:Ku protein [Nitrospirota bacterium]
MAGSTIWKGSIHFDGTDVPVKLHSAVKEEHIQFHLLHRRDQVRLRQQMLCALDGHPVPAGEQAKGFEVEKGKYVLIDPAELEQLVPEGSRMIDIREFVRSSQIAPSFLERVYYLEPDGAPLRGGEYHALVRIMKELDVSGIGVWSMRKRSYVGALHSNGNILLLTTLRHADEVIPADTLGLGNVPVTDRELEIGSELIARLTVPLDPARYANDHQARLQEMIAKKARGEGIAILSPKLLKPTPPDDLLRVLEESLRKAA